MNKYYDIFRRNFPYVSRENKTINEILENKDNIFIEKKNENEELMGVSVINKNTILMLCVEEQYRNKGIGTLLLNESEKVNLFAAVANKCFVDRIFCDTGSE